MVSIIVPTFNEEKNIENLLALIGHSFSKNNQNYEVIVIDDHSSDGTWELLQQLASLYPLKFFRKIGRKGKALSLYEGFSKSCGDTLVMCDADLQYPPEAIAEMVKALDDSDLVVANRKNYYDSNLRKFLSRTFRFAFGKFLFGIDSDIQSGLKVFKRRVWETVKFVPRSAWTFDLEFLQGAGIGFKRRQYITHTTLPHHESALKGFVVWQKASVTLIVAGLAALFYFWPLNTAIGLVAVLSVVYFIDFIFYLFLIIKSLHKPPEIVISEEEIDGLQQQDLPTYTVLCPLYKEAQVL